MSDTTHDDRPERSPAVYRLTPEEIEALRAGMKASGQWAKRQLEIDPELRHLDDRPPLADHIRQAPPLEGAIREVLDDESLAHADDLEDSSGTTTG